MLSKAQNSQRSHVRFQEDGESRTTIMRSHVRFQEDGEPRSTSMRSHVRFQEDGEPRSTSMYTGPRFPNLQMMFNKKSVLSFDEEARNEEAVAVQPPVGGGGRGSEREEDVNMEANEFIKRRRHNLELQKLMSTRAVA
ncbi:hypothetical protein MUK42_23124 [Musa troglodytarum]|uniref:Uncharacterized protein n=1 Tax=Musa troglodytarum TaxID=320322 RepID=A0A9E7G4L0_9LILI|nr:hypothetical protein MUK42_23124 [Musa troglodytarum]